MLRRLILLTIFFGLFGCSSTSAPPEGSIRLAFPSPKRIKPANDSLYPIFPNPFNRAGGDTSLVIQFDLRDSGTAILLFQNALGDEIAGYSDTTLAPGHYSGSWNPFASDGTPLNAGLYFVTLRTKNYIDSRLVNIEENE